MRHLLLLSVLLLIGSPPSEAATQRGQGGHGEQKTRPAADKPEGRGDGPARGRGAERVEVDPARARVRMTARLRWLGDELKMGPAQRKRLQDVFELELWAGMARGVEPFPSEPDLTKPVKRTTVVKITRGELDDREGLFGDSPLTALAGQADDEDGGGRGKSRGEGEAGAEGETGSDPAIPPGLSPAAAAALIQFRAEEVEMVVRTTHPMLADLTVSTLDGVMPLLKVAQVAPYLELLGDEGLFLVRAHAAHRISGYAVLDRGVARIKPTPVKPWSVAPRKGSRGRGQGGRGGNGGGRGNGGRKRY